MIYLLDTNILRKLLMHFPKKGALFERVWDMIDKMINDGTLLSVDECYNELKKQFSEDSEELKWLNSRKHMFKNPSNDDSLFIKELFMLPKMKESVHTKNIVDNRPSADAYLVALAKNTGAVIVTNERYKPHSAQLPTICETYGIDCIAYDDFMEILST